MALYEGLDLEASLLTKFWLREPSKELEIQIELCNTKLQMCRRRKHAVPSIYKTIKNIEYEFDIDKVKESLNKMNTNNTVELMGTYGRMKRMPFLHGQAQVVSLVPKACQNGQLLDMLVAKAITRPLRNIFTLPCYN